MFYKDPEKLPEQWLSGLGHQHFIPKDRFDLLCGRDKP
jgi:hypothetical protein